MKKGHYVWKFNVKSNELEKELLNIFGGFNKKTNMKSLAPNPRDIKKCKPYFTFSILQNGLRIRNFSFFNFYIKNYDDGIVEFQMPNSGHMVNWVHFNSPCDIIFDDNNSHIIIDVQGKVFYKDGTCKYDRRDDLLGQITYNKNQRVHNLKTCKEYYKDRNFLHHRKVTKSSIEYINKIKYQSSERRRLRKLREKEEAERKLKAKQLKKEKKKFNDYVL